MTLSSGFRRTDPASELLRRSESFHVPDQTPLRLYGNWQELQKIRNLDFAAFQDPEDQGGMDLQDIYSEFQSLRAEVSKLLAT